MAFPQPLVDALLARVLDHARADALASAPARADALASAPARMLMLSGAQASGKSTLAAQIVQAATARGIAAAAASLDDFYLDLPEREALAASVHPLLATRGVPGSHDLPLLLRTLSAIRAGEPTALPKFDKGRDRRAEEREWPRIAAPLRLFVLEGWCLGVEPQSENALRSPINALEAEHDADGRWRRYVNDCLRDRYMPLWSEFDLLAMLRAPSFAVIAEWRDQPEAALRAAGAPKAMSAESIRRFVQHYQRLSEHALATLPGRADIVLHQDAQRRILAIDDRMPQSIDHPLAQRALDAHEDAHD
jgi:D-glycerate 3-kinase